MAIVCALLIGIAQPAGADTPQEKLDRAQARLDELADRLEIQIEECNTRREQVKSVQRAVRENRSEYEAVRSALDSAENQRGDAVAEMYMQQTGSYNVETLTSGAADLNEYAERLTLLDITTKARSSAFERYAATQDALDASATVLRATEKQAEQANDAAQTACDETKQKVEAEQDRVAELAAEVERLERAARRRAAERAAEQESAAPAAGGSGNGGSGNGGGGASSSVPKVSGNAAGAVQFALAQVGKPYQWGGSGPNSYDCSGLTSAAWGSVGVSLPHSSSMQYGVTRRISRSQLQPGDLMFFGSPIHHEAMYIGNGQMVESPRTGLNVRVVSTDRSDYVGAGRP